MKGDKFHVELKEPTHLDALIDHLRANARFESMLAQRLGSDHPAQEAFNELAEAYLDIADAIEGLTEKRIAELRAEEAARAQELNSQSK